MTSVGELKSIVRPVTGKAPSFEGERYKAKSYVFDTELNEWVSFYWIPCIDSRHDGNGNQCDWYHNRAEEDNEEHFGIKLTDQNLGEGNAKAAALAMYQRQKMAAENDLAPPVHGMCCVKFYSKNSSEVITKWGYLTSCAHIDCDFGDNPNSLAAFEEFLDECRAEWDKLDELENYLSDCDWISSRIQNKILDYAREEMNYPHPDDADFESWCHDNDMPIHDLEDLESNLNNLDVCGLQHDFYPLGRKYPGGTWMGFDLHEQNIGLWKGKIVCIDFGHHCLGGKYRDACE